MASFTKSLPDSLRRTLRANLRGYVRGPLFRRYPPGVLPAESDFRLPKLTRETFTARDAYTSRPSPEDRLAMLAARREGRELEAHEDRPPEVHAIGPSDRNPTAQQALNSADWIAYATSQIERGAANYEIHYVLSRPLMAALFAWLDQDDQDLLRDLGCHDGQDGGDHLWKWGRIAAKHHCEVQSVRKRAGRALDRYLDLLYADQERRRERVAPGEAAPRKVVA